MKNRTASHCDECVHATIKFYTYRGSKPFDILTCSMKHRPRYYKPTSNPFHTDWGWKRVCTDFEVKP